MVVGNLCNFLKILAVSHIHNGQTEEALEDIRLSLFLAQTLMDVPSRENFLFMCREVKKTIQPIWEGLLHGMWSPAQMEEIQRLTQSVPLLHLLEKSMEGERCMLNEAIAMDRRGDMHYLYEGHGTIHFQRWRIRKNQVGLNRWLMEANQNMVSAGKNRVHAEHSQKYIARKNEKFFPERMWFPYYIGSGYVVAANVQSALDQAWIACQLEIHKLSGNGYPSDLAGLGVPLPNDVTTGNPYQYSPTIDGRYKLYSVGWNQVDDGGHPGKRPYGYYAKDWLWHYTPSP